ncbi:metal-dependent hydrolase [Aurantiacibacter poecillastricola]|uniref:metal-dependent hydrolase n=1 Tax=Aurantiacibacter poecillastricola TaxID=3064385 RepID=UPI00273E5AC2|nr:metal-dependent hydrolase [Aurantiacibacter sp. 219JJ12-13]MDP5261495.1 metal-dependent hydrolase [Aurantiacibacter sp. 219JJ12-13]
MSANSTSRTSPSDLTLTVRDQRFGRNAKREKGVDPVASAWFAALSASFPRGEAMFIDAVKAFRDDVPEDLAREIRAFIKQEVNHSREHLAFNRALEAAGYDIASLDKRIAGLVAETQEKPAIVQLAITAALEHFTAMFAHQFLKHPDRYATPGMGDPALWSWHAVEEIEHKGVAFDTWLHATRDWKPMKRWSVRNIVMLKVTGRFLRNRMQDALALLEQDGITGTSAKLRLAWHLLGNPGKLRRIFPAWLGYFRPGFHPWDEDDRYLIARHDSEYAAANLESVPAQ